MTEPARPALPATLSTRGDHRRHARLGYVAVTLAFGGFGAFAALAPIDSAAIAPAQVAVESHRKPLQHLEGGIVREILVREAERVAAGQVLFRLDPTGARANAQLLRKQIDTQLALQARLIAEQEQAPRLGFPDALLERRRDPETATVLADQQRQFDERKRSLDGQLQILKARIEQTTADMAGRRAKITALEGQARSLAQEIAKVRPLAARGLFPANKLLAHEREVIRLKGEMEVVRAEMGRTSESIEETRLQMAQVQQKFQEDVAQQLAELRGRLSDMQEKQAVASDVVARLEVRAPRDGIVQNLKVFAAGSVVRAGETMAELVPASDELVVLARVQPIDIDAVEKGRRAQIRFPSFSSRETATILGTVEAVSADSLVDDVTKQPYFQARVVVDQGTLPAALARRIVPGMPADVLISTGERTLLRYLTGPLMAAVGKGLRER